MSPSPTDPGTGGSQQGPEATWGLDQDTAFSLFVARCLSHVGATGCREVRRIAEGIREIHREWDLKRDHAKTSGTEELVGQVEGAGRIGGGTEGVQQRQEALAQVSALGWALRCIAQAAWEGHPGWDASFRPHAVTPGAPDEDGA